MLKSKSAMFGIAAALVAGLLLVAGLGVTSTSGAPTDLYVPSDGIGDGLGDLVPGGEDPGTAPASPVEPTIPTSPTTDPSGGAGAGAAAPGTLPDAGFGAMGGGDGVSTLLVLFGLAGVALVGAGASVAASKRN